MPGKNPCLFHGSSYMPGELLSNVHTAVESFPRHPRIDWTCNGTTPHSDLLRLGQGDGPAGRQHLGPSIGPDVAARDRNARPPASGKDWKSPFALARSRAAA